MRIDTTRTLFLACMLLAAPGYAADATPAAVVDAFQAALIAGDGARAKSLLEPDVLIYEAGGEESSREEYAAHHLKDDMAFLAKAQVQVLERKERVEGAFAWVVSRSRIRGVHGDKPVNLISTETTLLKHRPEGWRIVHIHWSSRTAKD